MGTCYYSHGEPTQQKIFASPSFDLYKMTLVYFKSNSRLGGWGSDSISTLAAEIIIDSGIYIDRMTGLLRKYPADLEFKIATIKEHRTLEIIAAESIISAYLDQSDKFEARLRTNALRERYGKQPAGNLEPPAILSLYDRESDLIDVDRQRFEELEVDMLIKWKHSSFSLHCYAISTNLQTLHNLIARLSKIDGLKVVQCDDDSLIPVV